MDAAENRAGSYLCVEPFLRDMAGAVALRSALELGLIDALLTGGPLGAGPLDERGLGLLQALLRGNNVIEERAGTLRLTADFVEALAYRDLIEAKLDFARLVGADFSGLFTALLAEPQRFFREARLFELFSYDRCFDPTPENFEATARWVRITTALTRYEAPACLARHDFSNRRRMLDFGGNSGEFALQACAANPGLRATVYDLPVVCDLGVEHVRQRGGSRVEFARVTRPRSDPPRGFDLVSFKSMLHDWPEAQMRDFLREAHRSLEPGGTVLVFERRRFEPAGPVPYSMIPLLLFFRSYRTAGDYAAALAQAGFRDVRTDEVMLDMPFILVTGTK